jgi:hypothetical protein
MLQELFLPLCIITTMLYEYDRAVIIAAFMYYLLIRVQVCFEKNLHIAAGDDSNSILSLIRE